MPKQKIEEGQIVLCTVAKIVGTSVFVRIEEYNIEGTLTFMEIAPGRIRNIREYAFPGKKIVCKVLQIKPNHIELSFRRVKTSERNEFNENFKRERSYSALLRTILGEKESLETINNIKESYNSLVELLEAAKEKSDVLDKYFKPDQAQRILGILKEKKVKETEISQRFSLSSKASNGIIAVKNVINEALKEIPEKPEISYLAAGKYIIKMKTKDLKKADQQIRKFLEFLENFAKKNNCIFNEEKS